jgi:hypothetical protein
MNVSKRETNMEVPQRTKMVLPYDAPLPFQVIYSKESTLAHNRDTCLPHVYCNTIYSSQVTVSTSVPMDNENVLYIQNSVIHP